MKIVGYSDRLSVRPGRSIRFMVSCEHPTYWARIVRLRHTDTNPAGPGFLTDPVSSAVEGEYPGRDQEIRTGSYVVIPHDRRLACRDGFTLQAWICPTTPNLGEQSIIAKMTPDGESGYGLRIEPDRSLGLAVGGDDGNHRLSTGVPLLAAEWYFIAGSFDADNGRLTLLQQPVSCWLAEGSTVFVEATVGVGKVAENQADMLMAANWSAGTDGVVPANHFNGKIDHPRLYDLAFPRGDTDAAAKAVAPVARWDFSRDIGSDRVTDSSANGQHGRAVNLPARGMTGHNWSGDEVDFKVATDQYGAIHFHDDDLEDAGWDEAFTWTVPEETSSGVYAVHLQSEGGEDYLPFAVAPKAEGPHAAIAFLLPTLTYQVYANQQFRDPIRKTLGQPTEKSTAPQDQYMRDYQLLSTYDSHNDGSGVCYASRLRPLLNIRPGYRSPPQSLAGGWPRLLNADMHLAHWLDGKGFAYDVITDDDLNDEGVSVLEPYQVVLTGTHPEYWTAPMVNGMASYQEQGGRLMYLGGNGFYWIASFDPHRPHLTEVRRWRGSRAWDGKPGEHYHSTTGEMGGLWRYRNREPQKMLGIGFTSAGSGENRPYRRLPDSFDARAAFIFSGIDKEELIGDTPALVLGHGAGGFEIDRIDYALGTPLQALVLARTHDHPDSYQFAVEDQLCSNPFTGGSQNDLVHADMVYFEGPNGGAVFSVGSIAWCSCLSYNGADNNVSRLTENVLRKFVGES